MDAGGDPTARPGPSPRRQGLVVLAIIAIAIVVAAAMTALGDDPPPAPDAEGPDATEDTVEDEPVIDDPGPTPDPLHETILDLGLDVDIAPTNATFLDGARWCDVIQYGPRPLVDEAARCLAEARATGEEAVMVRFSRWSETETVTQVIRTPEPGDTRATVSHTRGHRWTTELCDLDVDIEAGVLELVGCDVGGPSLFDPLRPVDVEIAAPAQVRFEIDGFLSGGDTASVWMLESTTDPIRAWAWAGTAEFDGEQIAVDLTAPATAARLDHREFGTVAIEPLTPGDYDLVTGDGTRVAVVRVTSVWLDQLVPDGGEPPDVDPDLAILHDGGIGDVPFGVTGQEAIDGLSPLLGPVLRHEAFGGCVTSGFIVFESGVVVELWPGDQVWPVEHPDDDVFHAWYYGSDPFTGGTWPARTDLTTSEGIGLGSSLADLRAVGGGFSGGFDAAWGAPIWFTHDNVGGLLTADATDPSATVLSLSGGSQGTPTRMVC